MLEKETLRPVIIAMILYMAISQLLPELLKTPTGIKFIDDIVMMLISQKGSIASGAILTGVIVYATNYISDEFV
jgi:hypothetical protein|tara:strand:- start:301 stop:522 length:222 start_codon:yes stop_codon:yes gene_type:complete